VVIANFIMYLLAVLLDGLRVEEQVLLGQAARKTEVILTKKRRYDTAKRRQAESAFFTRYMGF